MPSDMQPVMYELLIKQCKSGTYHPESQGAIHQTLRYMLRTYCMESQKNWDEDIHFLLFAYREAS